VSVDAATDLLLSELEPEHGLTCSQSFHPDHIKCGDAAQFVIEALCRSCPGLSRRPICTDHLMALYQSLRTERGMVRLQPPS
jgi:hypothetical protein